MPSITPNVPVSRSSRQPYVCNSRSVLKRLYSIKVCTGLSLGVALTEIGLSLPRDFPSSRLGCNIGQFFLIGLGFRAIHNTCRTACAHGDILQLPSFFPRVRSPRLVDPYFSFGPFFLMQKQTLEKVKLACLYEACVVAGLYLGVSRAAAKESDHLGAGISLTASLMFFIVGFIARHRFTHLYNTPVRHSFESMPPNPEGVE